MNRETLSHEAQWLDNIPAHWHVAPLGSLFRERRQQTTSENDAPLSVTKFGIVDQLSDIAISYDGAPKKLVEHGDIVINSRSDRKGSSGITPRRGSVSVINTILEPKKIVPQYAHHLIRSVAFQEEFYRFGTGIVADLWSTRWSEMKNILLPAPPAHEQQQIADYLDHETAEIDAFIDQQSRLITLLEERRMATAGELIRYPAHFDDGQLSQDGLAPLKHLGTIVLGKMLDTKELDSTSTMHPYLRAANVQPLGVLKLDGLKKMRFTDHEKRALTILAGDVVVVEGGVGGFGRAAFVPTDLPGVGFQNSIIRVRPNKQSDGRFIAYALILLRHRGYINTVSSVSSMPHFTAEKVARTPVPRLPRARQSEIANELDSLWRTHSIASADAQIAIDLARERRAALITAAVTGQIDVTTKNKPAAEQIEDDVAQGLHREYA